MRTCLLCVCLMALAASAAAQSNVFTTHDTISNTTTTVDGDTTTTTTSESDATFTSRTGPPRMDGNFPYDSTEGRNRGDIDTARRGFDDPRDPWDGRYSNDNPRNYTNNGTDGTATSSARTQPNYAPGNYGTRRMNRKGGHHHDD